MAPQWLCVPALRCTFAARLRSFSPHLTLWCPGGTEGGGGGAQAEGGRGGAQAEGGSGKGPYGLIVTHPRSVALLTCLPGLLLLLYPSSL